jgi:hypothetical protein
MSVYRERRRHVAVCKYCEFEMTVADGCAETPIVIDGRSYPPIRFCQEPGSPRGHVRRCADCYVRPGRVHHHGCDAERCPACGDQSIGCDCIWAGEEHLREEWIEELEERFLLVGPDE